MKRGEKMICIGFFYAQHFDQAAHNKMFFQQLQRNMDRFQFGIQFKAKFLPVPLTDSHGSIILLHA